MYVFGIFMFVSLYISLCLCVCHVKRVCFVCAPLSFPECLILGSPNLERTQDRQKWRHHRWENPCRYITGFLHQLTNFPLSILRQPLTYVLDEYQVKY